MKYLLKSIFAVTTALSVFLFFTPAAYAQLTDNFDSYSDGDVVGQGGWTLVARGDASAVWSVEGTTVQAGAKAIKSSTISYVHIKSTFTLAAAGIQSIYFQVSNTTDNSLALIALNEGGTRMIMVQTRSDGTVDYHNGTTFVSLGAISTGTWYKVDIQWDKVNQQGKARYRLDNGTWTAYDTNYGGNYTSGVDSVTLAQDLGATTHVSYFDTLADGNAAPPAAPATFGILTFFDWW